MKLPLVIIELQNAEGHAAVFDLRFHWGDLPTETSVQVAFEKLAGVGPAVTARTEILKRHGIVVLRPRQAPLPAERRGVNGEIRRFDLDRIYTLSATRDTLIPGIRIPADSSLAAAIQVVPPPYATGRTLCFDVVQQMGKRIVGGSACVVQLRRRASA